MEMTVFIAFLRGINVGGHNRIKMTDLKRVFEALGFGRVETYMQSGNLLFEADGQEDALRKKIEKEIEKNFGLAAVVVLRTTAELKQLILACPFAKEEIAAAEALNAEGESFYVGLLAQTPQQEKIEYLDTFRNDRDKFQIRDRDIYLLFCHSIRNAKLANNLQKLEVPVTIRNWHTITKLQALVDLRMNNRANSSAENVFSFH